MKSLWNDKEARKFKNDALSLRVYTSRLLGQNSDLVLHGGGNTSVKTTVKNIFGESEEVLYVKGSGWDLGTIEKAGFAPVRLDALKKMAELKKLSDTDMVTAQRAAMTDPHAPNPSVEAILHAIIPFKFVDHTHADAVVTITNSPHGADFIRKVYGERVIYVPYVMPGFILARKIYEMTRGVNWNRYAGMVLLNHGIFSFHDDAKVSYERMIALVSRAERFLKAKAALTVSFKGKAQEDLRELALIRREVSKAKGSAMLACVDQAVAAVEFSRLSNAASIVTRGPLTPDHLIRTKRGALVISGSAAQAITRFAGDYQKYFKRNANGHQMPLDPAPRFALWPQHGLIYFGTNLKDTSIVQDIVSHTTRAIRQAEKLGGWKPLPEKEIFDMEYWELEQAKVKKAAKPPAFQGKVALVTGGASGIGRACVEAFSAQGAVVAALDIAPSIKFVTKGSVIGLVCDVTNEKALQETVDLIIRRFGGLDIIVSNAGTFPVSEDIAVLKSATWQKSLDVNLTSHQRLLKSVLPYLSLGIDPAVVIVGSKNVPAPGPGVAAYSVAKAGLTQFARVAALELAPKGIRVNVIHPNQVFDTAIWTKEVLEKRAKHYGVSVEEYKKSNLLKVEITSKDVAQLVCAAAGPVFAKTTGAQIPIDGGNDRVI